MAKRESKPKEVFTIRVNPEVLAKLRERATREGKTVSSLANELIEQGASGQPVTAYEDILFSTQDIEKVLLFVKSCKQLVPLKMILEVLKLQRD